MSQLFQNILPIFLSITLGSILKKQWLITDEFWRGLEKLSYFILFPAAIFNYIINIKFNTFITSNILISLILSTLLVSTGLIVVQKILSINGILFTSIFQGGIRCNSYIFLALSSSLFNIEEMTIVSIISVYMTIFNCVISIVIFSIYTNTNNKSQNWIIALNYLKSNPLIIVCVVGLILNYFNVKIPQGIGNFFSILGNGAFLTGTLTIGAGLKFIIRTKYIKYIFIALMSKLIVFPIITILVFKLFSITGTAKTIGLLYSCIPCSSNAYIFSKQLGGEPESMANIITISTICSLFSLSFLVYILS